MPGVEIFHAGTRREQGRWIADGGRVLAVSSIFRDVDSLQAELGMERAVAP